MFGLKCNNNILYIIDFGSIDTFKTYNGVVKSSAKFVGTPEYASYRVHKGGACQPLDDLISIGYILIKLINGKLPWSSGKSNKEVASIMLKTSVKDLCKNVPNSIKEYMTILYSEPKEINYKNLKNIFQKCIKGDEYKFTFVYYYLFRMVLLQLINLIKEKEQAMEKVKI